MSRTLRTARLSRGVALAALIVTAGACARFKHTTVSASSNEPVVVIFTNQSLDQADVFAIAPSGNPQRLGTVMAGHTDTLTLPASVAITAGRVDFVARMLYRNRAPRSGPVSISPGDRLRVTLPSTEDLLGVVPAPEP